MLILFASQAATAIANARTHRDERRARADLEALIETSPVGVAVFDGRTGRAVSFNREMRRIVENLQTPGRSYEQLMEAITFRLAEGREISLAEFPLAQQLSDTETVRAEEITLSVADGRSVTALVNATPIRGEDGEVVSMVVTLQDLEAAAGTRADAGRVPGHGEPRAARAADLDPRLDRHAAGAGGAARPGRAARVLPHHRRAGTLSVAPEPAEVAALVEGARTTFLSGDRRHSVLIDLPPGLSRVLADRRRMVQVLNNLLANAARHSPESSPIQVSAERDGVHVAISVTDQGRGVPPEQLPNLFRSYAGTAGTEGATAGTGLGLVICKGLVEAHGGRIHAESGGPGAGRARPRPGGRRRPADAALRARGAHRGGLRRAGDRATRRSCPASSAASGRTWSCSTCCCPAPTASR